MDYFKGKDDYNQGLATIKHSLDDGKPVNQYFKMYNEQKNMKSFTDGGNHHRENFFISPGGP